MFKWLKELYVDGVKNYWIFPPPPPRRERAVAPTLFSGRVGEWCYPHTPPKVDGEYLCHIETIKRVREGTANDRVIQDRYVVIEYTDGSFWMGGQKMVGPRLVRYAYIGPLRAQREGN